MDIGQIAQLAAVLAQEGDKKAGGGILTLLLPLVLLGAVAYFLLIRPQQKQRQQHSELVSQLEPGDEVVTIGGIFGEIVEIDENRVTLEMYDGTQIEFLRTAISRKVAPEREETPDDQEPDDDGDTTTAVTGSGDKAAKGKSDSSETEAAEKTEGKPDEKSGK